MQMVASYLSSPTLEHTKKPVFEHLQETIPIVMKGIIWERFGTYWQVFAKHKKMLYKPDSRKQMFYWNQETKRTELNESNMQIWIHRVLKMRFRPQHPLIFNTGAGFCEYVDCLHCGSHEHTNGHRYCHQHSPDREVVTKVKSGVKCSNAPSCLKYGYYLDVNMDAFCFRCSNGKSGVRHMTKPCSVITCPREAHFLDGDQNALCGVCSKGKSGVRHDSKPCSVITCPREANFLDGDQNALCGVCSKGKSGVRHDTKPCGDDCPREAHYVDEKMTGFCGVCSKGKPGVRHDSKPCGDDCPRKANYVDGDGNPLCGVCTTGKSGVRHDSKPCIVMTCGHKAKGGQQSCGYHLWQASLERVHDSDYKQARSERFRAALAERKRGIFRVRITPIEHLSPLVLYMKYLKGKRSKRQTKAYRLKMAATTTTTTTATTTATTTVTTTTTSVTTVATSVSDGDYVLDSDDDWVLDSDGDYVLDSDGEGSESNN